MVRKKYQTAEEIMRSFKKRFDGDLIEEPYMKTFENGVKKIKSHEIFVRVNRERFIEAAEHLSGFDFPHHTVASGSDIGEEIEILFHFEVYPESVGHGVVVTIGTRAPKSDPHIPSISDVFPSVTSTEREKQEFLGIGIDGIKDNRRLFLTHAVPVGVYPWRKDEHGPEELVRKVHSNEGGGSDGLKAISDYNPFPKGGPPVTPRKKGGDS